MAVGQPPPQKCPLAVECVLTGVLACRQRQQQRPGRERAGELSQDRRGVEQITASGVGFRQVVVQQGQVGQGQASPGSRRGAGFATV